MPVQNGLEQVTPGRTKKQDGNIIYAVSSVFLLDNNSALRLHYLMNFEKEIIKSQCRVWYFLKTVQMN